MMSWFARQHLTLEQESRLLGALSHLINEASEHWAEGSLVAIIAPESVDTEKGLLYLYKKLNPSCEEPACCAVLCGAVWCWSLVL